MSSAPFPSLGCARHKAPAVSATQVVVDAELLALLDGAGGDKHEVLVGCRGPPGFMKPGGGLVGLVCCVVQRGGH